MSELGLFPLGIVLLPTEQIPLHIFEERYQELIGECLAEEREFGLVYADEDGLREIGTFAAVTEVLDKFDDGRLNIVAEGRERFRLVELTEGRSFQTGIVEEIADEPDDADPDDTEHALELYQRLVELTGAEVEEPRLDVAAALVRARRPFRVRSRAEAAAAAADLRAPPDEAARRAARRRGDGRRARARDRRARSRQRQGRSPGVTRTMEAMAVTTHAKLDVQRIRADFPYLEELSNGKPVAFLDSAASTQKPRQVLDAIRDFYEHRYANVHRGVYRLAERATEGYEGAREKVRAFVNAASTREVVFTRSATEGINLVAYAWGLENLGPGDVVVITELEHHSNFVPWQFVANRTGASFRHIPIDDAGELQLDALDEIAASGKVKVVANNLVSNSLGTINPVEKLAAWAHEQGAIMVVDAAQAAPHRAIDVQALGCDFLAISSHKLCGPSGVGALWGKAELLEQMSPFNLGGEMIRSVALDRTSWNELPYKFEAGTPAIAEAYGFGVAIDYLSEIGLDAIERHEHELTEYALGKLSELDFVRVFGPPLERRAGIVSFDVTGIHPHDVAQILDWEGVAVRAGHHCTQPLMARLGVAATTRASFYLYTIPEEIDRLIEGLHKVKQHLG